MPLGRPEQTEFESTLEGKGNARMGESGGATTGAMAFGRLSSSPTFLGKRYQLPDNGVATRGPFIISNRLTGRRANPAL